MHSMHRKDMFIIILVILVLALIADDSNQLSGKIGDIADSIEAREGRSSIISGSVVDSSSIETADEIVKAAEKLFVKGESNYKQASSSYDNLNWAECINKCLSARNYYEMASDEFDLALEELNDKREESSNKVFLSFIDKSIEYYTCEENLIGSKISICEDMETACLHYSRDEESKGNEVNDELQSKLEQFEEEETSCADILESTDN